MCGIAGVLDRDVERASSRIDRLKDLLAHRGPDSATHATIGPYTIANTRLAIIDTSAAGNQPFTSSSGRYTCVFNGELYNYQELVKQHALQLPTHCDTALIPALWELFGPECLTLLRGMFAMAVVDREANTLVLARDPYGIKPLYWTRLTGGMLAFASEPKALAALEGKASVNPEAIVRYLSFGALAPDMAPFSGMHAVPPNSRITFNDDGDPVTEVMPIVHPSDLFSTRPDRPVTRELLRDTVIDSVLLHNRADVPTALLLSAGLDSAVVAAAARSGGIDLHCVTVQTPGADESRLAAETARRYGHDHTIVPAEIDEKVISQFFHAMQAPSIDGLNTYLVSRSIHALGFKVALSGLGADEIFGGYRHFRLLRWLPLLRANRRLGVDGLARGLFARHRAASAGSASKRLRLFTDASAQTPHGLSRLAREVLPADNVRTLTGVDPRGLAHAEHVPPVSTAFAEMATSEIQGYMQSMLLPDSDTYSMAVSLELRVPFVDRALVPLGISASAHRRPFAGKTLLVEALEDDFLTHIVRRPKTGFSLPMTAWLQSGPLTPYTQDLNDPQAPIWDILDRSHAHALRDRYNPATGRWAQLWALVALNAWLQSLVC